MSLRHAILGVLSAEPMTGYDLVQFFHESVGYVWSAPQSQIYPELRKMESFGLVRSTLARRGKLVEKRVYAITKQGEAELRRWVEETMEYPPERDPLRLRALYFDIVPFAAARAQLRAHIAYYQRRLEQWQDVAMGLRERRIPLLRKRLALRPPDEHEKIVALKAHAFDGNIARARVEIAWAEEGLRLLDHLELQPAQGAELAKQDGKATA